MAKYRFAIIGGAYDSFMGPVHRIAASFDGRAELVAGAFSRNQEKNTRSANLWSVDTRRSYTNYEELLVREQNKLDFVVIATPNNTHIPIITRAAELGYAIVTDKPLGVAFANAYKVYREQAMHTKYFMLTYNYSGCPMVKEARDRVLSGEIGTIHRVMVRYEQGWLQEALKESSGVPLQWRTDPEQVGGVLSLADIGSHAAHLLRYVTGLQIREVMAEARYGVADVPLDTDVNMLLRFHTDALGFCTLSQSSTGLRNPFDIAVHGSKGSFYWSQEESEQLRLTNLHGSETILHRGSKDAPVSARLKRISIGHHEGYFGAFANLYREFFRALDDAALSSADSLAAYDIPSYADGLDDLCFIEAAKKSFETHAWCSVSYPHRQDEASTSE